MGGRGQARAWHDATLKSMTSSGDRRCATCGAGNLGDALFCAVCGVALSTDHLPHSDLAALVDDTDQTERPVTAPPQEPAVTPTGAEPVRPAPTTAVPAAAPAEPRPVPGASATSRAWLFPTSLVVAVLAVAALVLVLIGGGGDDSEEPSATAAPATTSEISPATTVEPAPTTSVEPAASTSTTPETTAVPTTVATDPVAALTAIAASDLERALDLRERWVPQLSAKTEGTEWEGVVYDATTILGLHAELDERVGGALLVEGSTLAFLRGGERMAGWWFTLADVSFDDADDALTWCADAGFDRTNCAARLVTDRDDATGTLRLRPA